MNMSTAAKRLPTTSDRMAILLEWRAFGPARRRAREPILCLDAAGRHAPRRSGEPTAVAGSAIQPDAHNQTATSKPADTPTTNPKPAAKTALPLPPTHQVARHST